jgi:hypothetical protein
MTHDPQAAAYAWMRFRRIMRWLMAATVALVIAALRHAAGHAGSTSIRRYVLGALLAGTVMLLGSGVMGVSYLRRNLRALKLQAQVAGENPPPERRRPDAPE